MDLKDGFWFQSGGIFFLLLESKKILINKQKKFNYKPDDEIKLRVFFNINLKYSDSLLNHYTKYK